VYVYGSITISKVAGLASPGIDGLHWISSRDEVWIDETNVDHEPLQMGSPTTHGCPNAGYTGLFWRGPRAWTGADVIADGGHEGDTVMGTRGAWAAITGEHDELDGGATVLAYAGTTSASTPLTWFARTSAFARTQRPWDARRHGRHALERCAAADAVSARARVYSRSQTRLKAASDGRSACRAWSRHPAAIAPVTAQR
jgi:hypothetical protein